MLRGPLPVLLATLTLAACGGGGGGGSAPAPAPTPTPPAPPSPLSMRGSSAEQTFIRFSANTPPPSAPGAVVVTITDPDVTAPTSLDQINFDGDETVQIQVPPSTGPATYGPAQRVGGSNSSWSVTTPTSSGSVSSTFEVLSGPTRYVRAGRYTGSQDNGGVGNSTTTGYAVFGAPTPASAMPVAGTARFTGVSYGSFANRPVTVDVDFAGASLTGSINTLADAEQLTFAAPITGANFSGTASYRNINGVRPAQVSGSFFGPGAAELGGAYSDPSAAPTVYGGFVAAR